MSSLCKMRNLEARVRGWESQGREWWRLGLLKSNEVSLLPHLFCVVSGRGRVARTRKEEEAT